MVDYFNIIRILVSAHAVVLMAIPVAVRLLYCLKGVKMEGFSLGDTMFIIVNNSTLSFDSFGCESKNQRHNKIVALLVLFPLRWNASFHTQHIHFFSTSSRNVVVM